MKAAGIVVATVAALVVQTTVARFAGDDVPIDLILIVAVFAGLKGGPVAGLLTGTFGGLIQDAMSSGVIGIGAWAKTSVGFLAGVIGTQFIVARPFLRFIVFAAGTVVHGVLFMGVYEGLGLRHFGTPVRIVAIQAVSNAVLGVIGMQAAELLPGAVDRRRALKQRPRR